LERLTEVIIGRGTVVSAELSTRDLGDGVFRVGAFEGFVGPYALAGLHIAHGVSSLRGNDELTRVNSNAYTRADGIPLPSVMRKLLRHIHRISPSHAVVSALGEENVTSSFQRNVDLLYLLPTWEALPPFWL
jgi:hypothetical protein